MIIEYMEKYTGPDRGFPKKKVSRGDKPGANIGIDVEIHAVVVVGSI